MEEGQAAELAVFVISVSILLIYNALYFTPSFQRLKFKWRHRHYLNLWSVGAEARGVWAGAMMVASEGITAAQTIRNMVMGVSILAAGITLLASQLLLLLTDPARLVQVAKYSKDDPISGSNSLMSPEIKLGICLAILFVALLTMTQCVRLSVHLSFLLRAVPIDPKRSLKFQKIAFAINRRASLFFSLGLRIQYAFFPLFLYILGPLALLISTIVEVIALFLMDLTPDDLAYEDDETEQQVEDEIVRTTSMRRISLTERGNNSGAGGGVDGNGGEGLKPRVPYVSVE
ncbi:hypothetical protein NADE_004329 [Nannochloris sp. 'desiccata']|nr:hypothetical protein KSW81_007159 [Chlorella desiccata (nom. nud.)]KAH7621725.1 hypothetical protein NADE_004329 [Chlorella desiccata (nom. nud.)]